MDSTNKGFAVLLVLIMAISSLIIAVKLASAQTIPTPSTPQFTIKFVNASYSSTAKNSYNGQSQTQLINNNSIEITIKNQPFDYSNNGLSYQIYFNVRVQPHFSSTDNWTEVYPLENLSSAPANENGVFPSARYILPESLPQSNQDYTTIAFPVVPTEVYGESGYDVQRPHTGNNAWLPDFLDAIPSDAQLDFQVQALVGHNSTYWYIQHPLNPTYGGLYEPAIAFDSESVWSPTQIITIGEISASASPNPTQSPTNTISPTPTIPEISWLAIILLFVSMLLIVGKTRHRKIANLNH